MRFCSSGGSSARPENSVMPTMNMNTEPRREIEVLEDAQVDERIFGGDAVDDEDPQARDHQPELDPRLGGLEPVIIRAAVEQQLQRADAERQHAEAEEVEAPDLDRRLGHVEQQHGHAQRCRPAG